MEKSWTVSSLLYSGLLCCDLCNGLPVNLENTGADSHVQLLTGLVAVLLTVCSVVFLAGCLCCQRKNGFKEFRDSTVVASSGVNFDHGHVNPAANGEFTIFTPLSPPHQNNNVFLANQQTVSRTPEDYVFGDVDVSSWFNGPDSDFPRIKLKYINEIGKGWFGRVVEGAAQEGESWTTVVVRILEATASSEERVLFLHDASIYRCGLHPNILKLFGRCLDTIPLLILQESCPQGDLKKYLRRNGAAADKFASTEYPLLWFCQLTSALQHLHENKMTHPDLAARNCQLAANLTLKLGDYGLAVFHYPEDYYGGARGVPVRWCAPESLSYTSTTIQPKRITPEANVWSLAVTMWEICECGERPYANLNDDEVISHVLGSHDVRLGRPKYQVLYTDYIFRLMQLCWTSSESRPAVKQIDLMLGDLLQVYKNTTESGDSMGDFDKRWETLKPNSIVQTEATELELDDTQIVTSKPLSPSLNNLHGSFDNLLVENSESQMDSWLENVATTTGDMFYVKGLSDAIKDLDDAIASETGAVGSDSSHKLEFKLGEQSSHGDSSSEEENWKNKVERGVYSEKVRQKSRSVADLMILTHIDQSESESETPSLNYKNVRCAAKSLENSSLMFGSEGNLLNVQETFQDELKKLQEERRDSLFFVPENYSQNESSENLLGVSVDANDRVQLEESPSARILKELNEIKPANQVYNVFNVTINEFSPVRLKPCKLDDFIHFHQDCEIPDQTIDDAVYDSGVEGDRVESRESLENVKDNQNLQVDASEQISLGSSHIAGVTCQISAVPKLVDIIQDNDELMDYIIARYETEQGDKSSDEGISVVADKDLTEETKRFLSIEIEHYDNAYSPQVAFDLSEDQDVVMPNSLTHSSVFASTPYAKKSLPQKDVYASLNLFEETTGRDDAALYSLETWDSFLGKALDNQTESQDSELFDSFSSEPKSLLFVADNLESQDNTYVCDKSDATFVVDHNQEGGNGADSWETSGGGWFLHLQSNNNVSGEMDGAAIPSTDSYVGFNMDDEIMAAIRNELLNKLPQAQGCSNEVVNDDDSDWESEDRNEVFLRYNLYSTPLSPIPEESLVENHSYDNTPRNQYNSDDDEDDSDWSEHSERDGTHRDTESQSFHTAGSPLHPEPLHRHTPSQESCCSNDTLFNLEELTCAVNDSPHVHAEEEKESQSDEEIDEKMAAEDEGPRETSGEVLLNSTLRTDDSDTIKEIENVIDKQSIETFLMKEREQADDRLLSFQSESRGSFVNHHVATLPSPEDKPWKQLPASLLTYESVVVSQNKLSSERSERENGAENEEYYENIADIADFYNEVDYVSIVNMENSKNAADYVNSKQINSMIINGEGDESDIFGVLTDIRFHGPSDSQLMTTSFSESNDLNDEQDWDSGSETRSSSSGEFIWKEGEPEESLKTPQTALEDVQPLDGIQEESSSESSGSDENGESPEFIPSAWDKYATPTKSALRSPEKTLTSTEKKKSKAVWFKKQKYHCVYEYPREPDSPILNSYDLWKVHPDYSSFDDWELDANDSYIPSQNSDDADITQSYYLPRRRSRSIKMYQLSGIADYTSGADDEFFVSGTTKPFDVVSGLSSQFFPGNWSDSAKPVDNVTPDSGVEDVTPGSDPKPMPYDRDVQPLRQLALEAVRLNRKAEEFRNGDVLGGLRHTRNKLKLDLPPSPSAFTGSKMFNIEPPIDPVISREKYTFTTFGKSRFLVQHVDTPPGDESTRCKNVSFEALPYKPLQTHTVLKEDFDVSKGKVEIVVGEASLLDSADEDSGIESSTLERKPTNTV